MNYPKKDLNYFDTNSSNNFTNNYTNNIVQTYYNPRNQPFNNISNSELRKIIKDEFESFIKPYKNEILRLKGDINNKLSHNNCYNNLKLDLFTFVDKEVFNQRMKELGSEMDLRLNNLKASQNKINNILLKDINQMQIDINNLKKENSNKKILEINKEENTSFSDINKLNEIFENLQENMNSFKHKLISSIFEKNKISDELDLKFEDLNNECNANNYILFINKIKEDIKKINDELNIIKNENTENKIYEILEKLNLTQFSNFDLDKFYTILKSYNILMDNNLHTTNMINNLNKKIEKELNSINNKMNINKSSIEKNNTKISELIKEFSEEKNINLENKINIKTNTKKLIELEEKRKMYDEIIIKLDEENKKLENKIKNIEDKIIEERKKLNELNNEIIMNNNRNNNEKIQEINPEILNIKKEINNIKNDKIINNSLKSLEQNNEVQKEKELEKNNIFGVEYKKEQVSKEDEEDSIYKNYSIKEI